MNQDQTTSKPIYDHIGTSYQATRIADFRIVEKILSLLNKNNTQNLIDIGAGTGNYSFEIAKSDIKVTAVEPSEVMISQSKKHENLKFVQAVAENLPFENNFFDAVLSTLSIHHFKDMKMAFHEIYRVLKETGKIVFFTFDNRIIPKNFWMYEYFEDTIDEAKTCMPTKENLFTLLEEIGYKNISTHPFPLPDDLSDEFLFTAWKSPQRYLDRTFLNGISSFAKKDFHTYKGYLT